MPFSIHMNLAQWRELAGFNLLPKYEDIRDFIVVYDLSLMAYGLKQDPEDFRPIVASWLKDSKEQFIKQWLTG